MDIEGYVSLSMTPNRSISYEGSEEEFGTSVPGFEETPYDGPGRFNVTTTTTNSPLTVHFTSQPVDSSLIFKGQTTNSPALVSLAPAYEGDFTLATTLNNEESIQIRKNDDVEDPSGAGRRRIVSSRHHHDYRQTKVSGSVRWFVPMHHDGDSLVEVETSNGAVTLEL